jgi:hypothetical protein
MRLLRGWFRNVILVIVLFLFQTGPGIFGDESSGVPLSGKPDLSIRLDGRLDESLWDHPKYSGELTQQSPNPGQPTPFKTHFRVLFLHDRIYFGIECEDPDPKKVNIHSMQRDSEMEGDDTLSIVLDPYGDKRTGYFFRINAAGARADGLISNPEHISLDWDGLWDVRVAPSANGWSAEFEIPVQTISFTPGLKTWGMNIQRFVARTRTTLRWNSPSRDSFLYDMSRAGELPVAEDLAHGKGFEFVPYVVAKSQQAFGYESRKWPVTGGMDMTWRITPKLAAVLTGNTDFAETEVDSRQINVTRFPLFFPEKRAFFLEGSNQFEFGLGLGEIFIPFFSRRIGLLDGEQIPINFGAKLNGRIGKWNLAMLDVQTRETSLAPAANHFAGRYSYDLSPNLRVGSLFTHGNPDGIHQNALGGIDAVWQTSKFRGNKNLMIGGWTAMTTGDLPSGQHSGWGTKIDYPNDLWDCSFSVNEFGDAFAPALGFLPRPGVRRFSWSANWMPRPSKQSPLGFIRQEFFENNFTWVTNLQGKTESWSYFMAPINIRLESGDRFEFNWSPEYEWLAAPFEITEGVRIPPGTYNFTRWRLEAQTSEHRPLQFGTTTWFGSFYDGSLTQWENYLRWTSPAGRYQVGISTDQNFGRLKSGNFVQRLWQLQTAFAWSPNLVLTSFIQYDSESKNVGTNTRFCWTLKPGRELYLIWNRGWRYLRLNRDDFNLIPESEAIALKFRWTLRF